jgi:YesN/AraC family two-component response regulator
MRLKDCTVLYADDELVLRESMSIILGEEVKELFLAKDGKEAYEIYKEKNPDILLLDINMPYMKGIELVQKIRENDCRVRIIMITACSDIENLLTATELKLTKYVVKPFFSHELFEALNLAVTELSNNLEKRSSNR